MPLAAVRHSRGPFLSEISLGKHAHGPLRMLAQTSEPLNPISVLVHIDTRPAIKGTRPPKRCRPAFGMRFMITQRTKAFIMGVPSVDY